MAHTHQQQFENTAVTNAFLGALNAFVRNAIGKWNSTADILNYLIKVSPIPAGKVDKINDEWLYRLEDFTRSLSSDDVTYAAGQLLGDVGTVVAEYLLLGKVISLLGKVAGKIGQGIKGITYYLSNGMPAAADGVIAIGGAKAIAISGSLKSALVSAGDILFNYSAFENDWDKLKEEWEEAENGDEKYSVSESRRQHILDGEGPSDPGHGPNRGFSEGAFPDSWTDDQAISAIEDVANNPKSTWKQSTGPGYRTAPITYGGPDANAPLTTSSGNPVRFIVRGQNHGLNIEVIVEPNGEGIITGYCIGK